MMELPVDKDGEYIHINDTVYDKDGEEYEVTGYKTLFEDTNIFLSNGSEPVYATVFAHDVTHKQPVTVKLLAKRLRDIIAEVDTTQYGYAELPLIANELERLGDNDE